MISTTLSEADVIGWSAFCFCWVMLPICYYLGFRDGRRVGFKRGLPMGAIAYMQAEIISLTRKEPRGKIEEETKQPHPLDGD